MTFVDTSAFFAAADRDDEHHAEAARLLSLALERDEPLLTHAYVLSETTALIHRRLGHSVARRFLDSVDRFRVVWIDDEIHARAAARFAKRSPADLSLVDCASFVVMDGLGVRACIAFDRHFSDQGYTSFAP
ncbi:MAG: PIN domain-containing protein [Deltaproteobacteria bacterium]|nr:PIN domain-containing protein [Deltaproteobacteria bacterium]